MEPPGGQWNLTNSATLDVLKPIITQFTSDFSSSPYFHLGGDEINVNCATLGTPQNTDKEKNEFTSNLVRQFMSKLINFVQKVMGKKVIMWDDGVLDY